MDSERFEGCKRYFVIKVGYVWRIMVCLWIAAEILNYIRVHVYNVNSYNLFL